MVPRPARPPRVCRAAVAIARAAVPEGVLVAGDLGPTGALLAPYGDLEPATARAAFAEQAAALAAAGVDLLWVESMADLAEACVAVEGARDAAPGLPIVATLTFERGRTLFGDGRRTRRQPWRGWACAAVGANCGGGFETVLEVLPGLRGGRRACRSSPRRTRAAPSSAADGTVTYPATPADASAYARRAVELGASIVGGCCGTTADHVAAIAGALAAG